MRGPNPPRYLDASHTSVAWTELPQPIVDRLKSEFPDLGVDALDEVSRIYAQYQLGIADAQALSFKAGQTKREFGIQHLENATVSMAHAIEALPDQAQILEKAYLAIAHAQIVAKQAGPTNVALHVPSVAEIKGKAARALIGMAERRDLDPVSLVKAIKIHKANSDEAWRKWFDRCKPSD